MFEIILFEFIFMQLNELLFSLAQLPYELRITVFNYLDGFLFSFNLLSLKNLNNMHLPNKHKRNAYHLSYEHIITNWNSHLFFDWFWGKCSEIN